MTNWTIEENENAEYFLTSNPNVNVGDTIEVISYNQLGYKKYKVILGNNGNKTLQVLADWGQDIYEDEDVSAHRLGEYVGEDDVSEDDGPGDIQLGPTQTHDEPIQEHDYDGMTDNEEEDTHINNEDDDGMTDNESGGGKKYRRTRKSRRSKKSRKSRKSRRTRKSRKTKKTRKNRKKH